MLRRLALVALGLVLALVAAEAAGRGAGMRANREEARQFETGGRRILLHGLHFSVSSRGGSSAGWVVCGVRSGRG
jgi:hypothetical protein